MQNREITVEVNIGMLACTLKILLNFINIFIMKYYVKHITPLLERLDYAQILLLFKFW